MKNICLRHAISCAIHASYGVLLGIGALAHAASAGADAQPLLTNHVRDVVHSGEAAAIGTLPSGRMMSLDLVLPLRDPEGLDRFLSEVYDPASASYGQFLTPAEFTAKFGPTQADYDALLDFAKTHGFLVSGGSRDGMEIQVKGPVSAVEAAFHVTIRTYHDPVENRTFFAPDREPTVDLAVRLWHVSGLDDYSVPHPMLVKRTDYAAAHGIDPEAAVPTPPPVPVLVLRSSAAICAQPTTANRRSPAPARISDCSSSTGRTSPTLRLTSRMSARQTP